MAGFGNAEGRAYVYWPTSASPSTGNVKAVEVNAFITDETFDIDFIDGTLPGNGAPRHAGRVRLTRKEAVYLRNALNTFIDLPLFADEEREAREWEAKRAEQQREQAEWFAAQKKRNGCDSDLDGCCTADGVCEADLDFCCQFVKVEDWPARGSNTFFPED